MAENYKLVEILTDSAVLVILTDVYDYLMNKIFEENFLRHPSSSIMNYSTDVLSAKKVKAIKLFRSEVLILEKEEEEEEEEPTESELISIDADDED